MQKKFLGNLLFIILLNIIIKPFFIFGIDVKIQNIVGAESYGLYFTLLNLSFLFNIFLDIGVTNYNTKNTAQHPLTIHKYLGSFLGLKLMLLIPYVVLTVSFALLTGYDSHEIYWLGFFIFNQFLVSIILYMRSNFAGLHLFKIDAFLSVLDRLLLILIIGSILYGNIFDQKFKIEWFIYAQTFSYLVTVLIGFALTKVKIGKIKLTIRSSFSWAILKQSTPFALLILLMMLYTRIDSIMLERMLPNGKEQAGVYAQVFRLLDAVNMFAFLVAGLLLPIFSRLISEKQAVKPILQIAGKLLVGIAIVTGVGLAINSEFTISLIYDHNIESSSKAFVWLILGFIPMSISHVFGTLLTANHSLKFLNVLGVFGIVTNVGLNLYLIPKMEVEGAAIATLCTQTIVALGQVAVTLRVFKFSIQWEALRKVATLVILYFFTSWYLMDNYGHTLSFLLTFSIGLFYLFSLKLINIRDILSLVKTKVDEP